LTDVNVLVNWSPAWADTAAMAETLTRTALKKSMFAFACIKVINSLRRTKTECDLDWSERKRL